jgi:hypothetical protein
MNLTYESLVHLIILLLIRCYTELDRNYEHDTVIEDASTSCAFCRVTIHGSPIILNVTNTSTDVS